MRIIVNADDLGISAAVNEAVFGLMAEGLVTSATLRAKGKGRRADGEARQRDFGRCSAHYTSIPQVFAAKEHREHKEKTLSLCVLCALLRLSSLAAASPRCVVYVPSSLV